MRESIHKMALFAISFLIYLTVTIFSVIMVVRANTGGDAQEYTFLGMTFLTQEVDARSEWFHSFTLGWAVFYFPLILSVLTLFINEIIIRLIKTEKQWKIFKKITLSVVVGIIGFLFIVSYENVEGESAFRVNFNRVHEFFTDGIGFDDSANRNLEDYLFPIDNFYIESGEDVRDEFQVMAYSIVHIIISDSDYRSRGTAFLFEKTDDSLYFLTNEHVVEESDSVNLYFGSNRENYRARVIAKDDDENTSLDVAVLEVSKDEFLNPEWLHAFEFHDGTWNDLEDEEQLITFGFPESDPFFNTVLYQRFSSNENELIYEHSLRSGSSGSPILNQDLEVVGLHWGERGKSRGIANPIEKVSEFLETIDLD